MGFAKEDFEKHAYNGPVYNTIGESITNDKGSQKDLDRKLRLSKKFFCFGLVTFCIGFLMIGFAIGRLSSSSSNAEADGFQTEVTAGDNVYVSDSPGSKRYHKDRNCPALKRSTGKITFTDEANAIDQGKTLCGWCGK